MTAARRCLFVLALVAGCGGYHPAAAPIDDPDGGDDDFCSIGFGACADGGVGDAARINMPVRDDCEGPYFPMEIGDAWLYEVVRPLQPHYMKATAVVRMEPVPVEGPHFGEPALRIETKAQKSAEDETVSWQLREPTRIIRLAENDFTAKTHTLNVVTTWAPYKLRLDEAPNHTMPGTSWREIYTEVKAPSGMPSAMNLRSDTWIIVGLEQIKVPAGTFKALHIKKATTDIENGKSYWFARCVGKVLETGGKQTESLVEYKLVR